MTDITAPDAADTPAPVQRVLQTSESTAFYLWLLITVSAGIIMAQDSWYAQQHPRLDTTNLTATFTKVLVIHTLWFLISAAFVAFTWMYRPSSAWKLHIVVGVITCLWTLGVLGWAFRDVERLHVTTWTCASAPARDMRAADYLDSCDLADGKSTIRMGSDIYLWTFDDTHFWRWIVPGNGKETLRTRWPESAMAIYLASDTDKPLVAGSTESGPGTIWSASFDPATETDLHIVYIKEPTASASAAQSGSALATYVRQTNHALQHASGR